MATIANPLVELPTPESIAKYVKKNAAAVKAAGMSMQMGPDGAMESVRQDDFEGHHIVIRTSYHVEIDGKEVMVHMAPTNDGQVQYHGLPNYSFDSAMDLVKKMIQVYPDDFASQPEKPSTGMDMNMPMPRARKRSQKKAAKASPKRKK